QKLLSSQWRDDGNVEICSLNYARIPDDAAQNGNFSLELPKVHPKQDKMNFSLFHPPRVGLAHLLLGFVRPEETAEGNETTFLCLSGGGYPEPVVTWLISDSLKPPEGSLYNVTSYLTVNISKDSSVTCIIENPSMNESLRVTRCESLLKGRALRLGMSISTRFPLSVHLKLVQFLFLEKEKNSKLAKKTTRKSAL
uniref:Ig-like domain-containing protein n=1 Tax=Oryzias latipes TaxID=8090 RepID=A0A3B3IA54_ORYLA